MIAAMKPKNDLPQFSGLRGIAALLVLFFHVRTPQHTELDFGAFDSFSKFGYLGVDAFFVLSGYILSHVYRDNFATGLRASVLRSYGVARSARIYPLHLASLLLMLGAYFVALRMGVRPTEDAGYTWRGIILGLLLVHEWFGAIAPNPSSWSISIELANYILFPFLMLLPRAPRLLPIIGIVVGAVIVETSAGHRVLRSVIEFLMGACVYGSSASCDMKSLHRVGRRDVCATFCCCWMARSRIVRPSGI
ncbi:MAG TPA: acyltransferase [Pseudolabrys sp.]|nr:acyltransferase [Pseudolabrys sp.]